MMCMVPIVDSCVRLLSTEGKINRSVVAILYDCIGEKDGEKARAIPALYEREREREREREKERGEY